MVNDIVRAMRDDMKIFPYSEESDCQYIGRLIYSALSQWLRVATQDELYGENISKSKRYIFNRGVELLNNFTEAIPEASKYFLSPEGNFEVEDVIRNIREKMLTSGELIEVGKQKNVTIPIYSEVVCASGFRRIVGIDNNPRDCVYCGITRICKNEEKMYVGDLIESEETLEFLAWIYKKAMWTKCSDLSGYEIFNPMSTKVPYQSWSDRANRSLEWHLGRVRTIEGYEYWLLKLNREEWFQAPFPSVLHEYKEERRVILALRKKCNNEMNAMFEYKGNDTILYLYCGLPLKEESILETFCWPQVRYNDKYKYVMPTIVWDGIRNILVKNLGMTLREKR